VTSTLVITFGQRGFEPENSLWLGMKYGSDAIDFGLSVSRTEWRRIRGRPHSGKEDNKIIKGKNKTKQRSGKAEKN